MIYINQEKDELVKYEVEIDIEKLKELKIEIINNCAEIKHRFYEDSKFPNYHDLLHIRNYNFEFIKTEYFNNTRTLPQNIYKFEYDEYIDPILVTIIDKLLSGDTTAIKKLDNPKENKKCHDKPEFASQFQLLEHLLSIETKKERIEELQTLKRNFEKIQESYELDEKLNLDRKPILEYYKKVKECIAFTEISRVNIVELEEVLSFFENVSDKNLDQNINTNKMLQKLIK